LIGTAIAMRAVSSGPLAVAGFTFLMVRRVIVEESALAVAAPARPSRVPPPE